MMHQSHINRPYDPERGTGVPRRRFIANVCLALQSATGKRSGWVCRDRQGSPATLRRRMNSTPETPGIGIKADSCRTPNRRERLTADNCPVANLPNAAWAARRARSRTGLLRDATIAASIAEGSQHPTPRNGCRGSRWR